MMIKKRLTGLLIVFLGSLTTIASHGIEVSQIPSPIGYWSNEGFPLAFHHEVIAGGYISSHDWAAFLADVIIWSIVWGVVFMLITKKRKVKTIRRRKSK